MGHLLIRYASLLQIVPDTACLKGFFIFNQDTDLENCNHVDLAKFPTPFDKTYTDFVNDFTTMIQAASLLRSHVPPLPASLRPKSPILGTQLVPPPPPGPGPMPPGPPIIVRDRRKRDRSPGRKRKKKPSANDDFQNWKRKKEVHEMKESRDKFLRSLSGWNSINTGSEIVVAPGTCEWFQDFGFYKAWVDDPACGTFFFIGAGAQGKTHLAKAITTDLASIFPKDRVLSFFCDPQDEEPAIWEYFTWRLIVEDPKWFEKVPAKYRERDEKSPRLGIADYIEIWTAFRKSLSTSNIHLIIDGLEQCGDAVFNRIVSSIQQLRKIPIDFQPHSTVYEDEAVKNQPLFKVLLTCRLTDAVYAASTTTSRATMEYASTKIDISRFIDDKITRYSQVETLRQGKTAEELMEQISNAAGHYWPYAKFAIAEFEASVPIKFHPGGYEEKFYSMFSSGSRIPVTMANWLRAQVLPILQSVENNNWKKTVLLLLLSDNIESGSFMLAQLQDILACLYGEEAVRDFSVADGLRKHLGNIVSVKERGPVTLMDASVREFLQMYLTEAERDTNMAFACLKYLLQDCFHERLPISWDQRDKTSEWLDKQYPFYRVAANTWQLVLTRLKHVDDKLQPLLIQFLDPECEQFKTWRHGQAWARSETQELAELEIPPIISLVSFGAVKVLKHLYGDPAIEEDDTQSTWKDTLLANIWGQEKLNNRQEPYLSLPPGWPNIMGHGGRPALHFSAFTDHNTLETFDWLLSFDPDVEIKSEAGRSLFRILFGWKYSEKARAEPGKTGKPSNPDTPDPPSKFNELKIPIAHRLLDWDVDIMSTDSQGITALHVAAHEGNMDALYLLLDCRASVNASELDGTTPLEVAYFREQFEVVREFYFSGVVDTTSWWSLGRLPISQAYMDQNEEMFDTFLRWNNPNALDRFGHAIIHIIAHGTLESHSYLTRLLRHPMVDVNILTKPHRVHPHEYGQGCSALQFAVSSNKTEVTRMLLEAGAYAEPLTHEVYPPLIIAIRNQNLAMVELLLSYQASPNRHMHGSKKLRTALGEAVYRQDEDAITMLLAHGADPTIEEGYGDLSVLHIALSNGKRKKGEQDEKEQARQYRIIKQLLEARIPPNVDYVSDDFEGDKGEPVLYLAARRGMPDALKLLLEHGANTSRWTAEGEIYSPIHFAATKEGKNYVDVCIALIEHDPGFLDLVTEEDVNTPLMIAADNENIDLVRELLKRGADPNKTSLHYNNTPLIMSINTGNTELVKLLAEAGQKTINQSTYNGLTALMSAAQDANAEVIEILFKAGAEASIYYVDCFDDTCLSQDLFKCPPGKVIRVLKVFQKYGVNFNDIHLPTTGTTVLGSAIESAEPEVIKWMIENGGDPFKVQRSHLEPYSWTNGLQLAMNQRRGETLKLLLEPKWGLREHIADVDYLGDSVLPTLTPKLGRQECLTIVLLTCEEIRKETGQDLFMQLLHTPCITGKSPWQYLGLDLRGVEDEDLEAFDRFLMSLLTVFIDSPKKGLLNDICSLLVLRGGFDGETAVMLSSVLSAPLLEWREKKVKMINTSVWLCSVCEGLAEDKAWACRICPCVLCTDCMVGRKQAWGDMHRHHTLMVILESKWVPTHPHIIKAASDVLTELKNKSYRENRVVMPHRLRDVEELNEDEDGEEKQETELENAETTEKESGKEDGGKDIKEETGNEENEVDVKIVKVQELPEEPTEENGKGENEAEVKIVKVQETAEDEENAKVVRREIPRVRIVNDMKTSVTNCSDYEHIEQLLQISLQLATLHAFGYLAVRKSLFTPYLPLAPRTEAMIYNSWGYMIHPMVSMRARWDLGYEGSGFRRYEELRYLKRGMQRSYVDLDGHMSDLILEDMRWVIDSPLVDLDVLSTPGLEPVEIVDRDVTEIIEERVVLTGEKGNEVRQVVKVVHEL